jgi:hypothetical protein
MHLSHILNRSVLGSPPRAALLVGLMLLVGWSAGPAREHRDGLAISGAPASSVTSGQLRLHPDDERSARARAELRHRQ